MAVTRDEINQAVAAFQAELTAAAPMIAQILAGDVVCIKCNRLFTPEQPSQTACCNTGTTVVFQTDCAHCGSGNCAQSMEISDRDQVHPTLGFPIPEGYPLRHNYTHCSDCGAGSVS